MDKSKSKNVKKASPSPDRNKIIEIPGLGKETELYAGLFKEVIDFINENYEDVVTDTLMSEWSGVFPDGPDDPSAMPVMMTFYDWLVHTASVLEIGYTGIELYLEKAGRLPFARREMLERMNHSVVSLFELQVFGDRKAIRYTDLILGDEFELNGAEITGDSDRLMAGARRIALDGRLTAGMATYPFPIKEKEYLLEEIQVGFEDYRIDEPEATLEEYLQVADPLPDIWLDGFEEDDFEEGEDDGGSAVTYTALFDILDKKQTLAKLRTAPSLHKVEKDVFEWIDDPDDPEQESRGAVVIMESGLALGAYTPEMREAGKIMLLSVCSGLIRHRTDLEVDEDLFGAPDEES
ncbi:MAG: hypothetical protein ACYC9O_00120 [Candidatus Latescibacterota bacterium]